MDAGLTIISLLKFKQGNTDHLRSSSEPSITLQLTTGHSLVWCSRWLLVTFCSSQETVAIKSTHRMMTTLRRWWSFSGLCRRAWPLAVLSTRKCSIELANWGELRVLTTGLCIKCSMRNTRWKRLTLDHLPISFFLCSNGILRREPALKICSIIHGCMLSPTITPKCLRKNSKLNLKRMSWKSKRKTSLNQAVKP